MLTSGRLTVDLACVCCAEAGVTSLLRAPTEAALAGARLSGVASTFFLMFLVTSAALLVGL